MNEQLKVTPRHGDADYRCPYCHDLLTDGDAGAADDVQVECEGCGTQHHLACLTELGRCTVMGCDRPIDAAALADRPPATSRLLRLIRQRQRERVRQFVRRNAREPAEPTRNPRYVRREGGWGARRGPRAPLWEDAFARQLVLAAGALVLVGFVAVVVGLALS